MIKEAISLLVSGKSLDENQSAQCMLEIASGAATPLQSAALLAALRLKGESVSEIYGFAKVLREKAIHVNAPENSVDLCGTGGDASNSLNISTAASFVVAAAGVPVVKHGNKSVTSKCGSADVMEALGANIDLTPSQAETVLKTANITFLFAQKFHPAMRIVSPVRKELGIRTVFNLLGPLINPARVKHQLLGVYDAQLTGKIAEVLLRLGFQKALVVHCDGMDELCLQAPAAVKEVYRGKIESYEIDGTEFGLAKSSKDELRGGNAQENAAAIKQIFAGKYGPCRDAILLNAAAALYAAEAVSSIRKGVSAAEEALSSGKTGEAMRRFVEATKEYVPSKN